MSAGEQTAGTRLANPAGVPGADAVWRNNRDQFFVREAQKTSRLMIMTGMVSFAAQMLILIHDHYPTWRILAALGIYAGFVVGHKLLLHRRKPEIKRVEHAFIKMNVMSQLFVVALAGVTGGVHSPFLPGTLFPAIVSLLFFGPQSVSRWSSKWSARASATRTTRSRSS